MDKAHGELEAKMVALDIKLDLMLKALNDMSIKLALSVADRDVMHGELRDIKTCIDRIVISTNIDAAKIVRLDTTVSDHSKAIALMQKAFYAMSFLIVGGLITAIFTHFMKV